MDSISQGTVCQVYSIHWTSLPVQRRWLNVAVAQTLVSYSYTSLDTSSEENLG